MEAEVRSILTHAVLDAEDQGPNLAQAIRKRFTAVDGGEVQIAARQDMPRAADLSNLP